MDTRGADKLIACLPDFPQHLRFAQVFFCLLPQQEGPVCRVWNKYSAWPVGRVFSNVQE